MNKSFLVNEYVYFIKDKYTFKEQLILDNRLIYKIVYCFVVVDGDVVHCLLQSYEKPTADEKDKAIIDYLKNKKRLISFEYKNVKPIIELENYKANNK